MKSLIPFLLPLVAATTAAAAGTARIHRRQFIPSALPLNAPENEKQIQPALDYDRDSCYNVAAIGLDGSISQGLEPIGSGAEGCRNAGDMMRSNVYSRRRCNNGWCATIYDYYFPKDTAKRAGSNSTGIRHAIEHISVWTKQIDSPPGSISNSGEQIEYVAASSGNGESYEIRPRKDILFDYNDRGEHPQLVYQHVYTSGNSGSSIHGFRFATAEDVKNPQNHRGTFWRNPLVSWGVFPGNGLRDKLMNYNFNANGSENKTNFAISDKFHVEHLQKSIPKKGGNGAEWAFTFDPARDF